MYHRVTMGVMVVRLLFGFSLILIIAVFWGRRYNLRLANDMVTVLDESLGSRTTDVAVLGHGLGYGIDYELDDVFSSVKVIFTLLPRYAPLYLPIARLIGRRDLLKLTFICTSLPPGIGFLVSGHKAGYLPLEPDHEMVREEVWADDRRYWVYSFNSYVSRTIQRVIPHLIKVSTFRELRLDSRDGTVTVFLFPKLPMLSDDLRHIRIAIDSLSVR